MRCNARLEWSAAMYERINVEENIIFNFQCQIMLKWLIFISKNVSITRKSLIEHNIVASHANDDLISLK